MVLDEICNKITRHLNRFYPNKPSKYKGQTVFYDDNLMERCLRARLRAEYSMRFFLLQYSYKIILFIYTIITFFFTCNIFYWDLIFTFISLFFIFSAVIIFYILLYNLLYLFLSFVLLFFIYFFRNIKKNTDTLYLTLHCQRNNGFLW